MPLLCILKILRHKIGFRCLNNELNFQAQVMSWLKCFNSYFQQYFPPIGSQKPKYIENEIYQLFEAHNN